MVATREKLRKLIDELPEAELPAAERALEQIAQRHRLEEALANAPYDDEPLTDEDIAAIEEGIADFKAGRVMTTDELRRSLGLPPLDKA